ncbi:MAG TPA: hypothetical protein VEX66_06875 [Microlunatus sp.]|nr:hypothetical protein [Microlunatus sp.]
METAIGTRDRVDVLVAIPAHDEAADIGGCPDAVAAAPAEAPRPS